MRIKKINLIRVTRLLLKYNSLTHNNTHKIANPSFIKEINSRVCYGTTS
jgi:hypothetical protein